MDGGKGGGGGSSGTTQPPSSQGQGGDGFSSANPGSWITEEETLVDLCIPININSAGPGGLGTGGGGGGGGATRSNGTVPCHDWWWWIVVPRNYDPSRDWHTAGGDGGWGIIVFRYELNSATDLTYTRWKATGGLTHKDDNGDVYHIFVGPTFGGAIDLLHSQMVMW